MKLAALYKNNLVPSYDRIDILVRAINRVLEKISKQTVIDPDLTDDSKPYTRRQEVMNSIIKVVRGLPKEWKMSVKKKRAGGNFHYIVVHFDDLNINLVPIHLNSYAKLPKPSEYRGDMAAFNFAIMKDHGMDSDMDFQTQFALENDEFSVISEPNVPENIKDIPFGLLLIYDGANMQVPIRLAALTPEQDRFIFCDNVELLKKYSGVVTEGPVKEKIEIKKRRKTKLDTSQVNEYNTTPNVAMKQKQSRSEKR
ncbi:hypothetical protein [Paenibacillus alvei]|uniref:Uncharacterized protein n=1 Tax=Paenibacillus alvei TaxID=44250 RepID=A0A383RJQ4_PAEAL|nr:hypothetical protein [Paenibacillus alvei]SYX86921.1 conserved protein of unknown function [Paenibacillus alvei]